MCITHDFNCIMDSISILIAFITLIVTITIPIRIMKIQNYTNLESDYMSFEFAHAFQSVINFYFESCNCNIEKIPEEYIKRYKLDFEKLNNNNMNIPKEDILHYQRRYLNNYFLHLQYCLKSGPILRKKIRKQWTESEAFVVKILIYMNIAVDENPDIFKDISNIKYARLPRMKGLNFHLRNLYDELKDTGRWMQ